MLADDLTANPAGESLCGCLSEFRAEQPRAPVRQRRAHVLQGIARYRRRQDRLAKRGISRQLRFKRCVVRGHCWGMLAIRSRISHPPLRARLIPPTIEEGARY